jgi:CO/xanthine dehydrogenase FAD-binding subunit
MAEFACRNPESLEELALCLAQADERTFLLGGGTDLVVRLRDRGIDRGTLIDLSRLQDLDRIDQDPDWITVGANVTYAALAAHPLARRKLPCLVEMAEQVGSVQIRNLARLPGNLANASPAGDVLGTLLALDAQVEILDGRGARSFRPVAGLVTGIGRTCLARDEAIVGIRIPQPGPHRRQGYGKIGLGARRQMVIANVSLTLVLDCDPESGLIRDPRVALGSCAPVAFRCAEAEELMRARRPWPDLGAELAETLRARVAASIGAVAIFQHKLNDVRGLALDLHQRLFADALGG